MTPEEKIYKVLDRIENERRISPNPDLIEFKFYDNFVASGMVSANDERKILSRLEKEGVIKLHFAKIDSEIYRILEPDLSKRHSIQVEALSKFHNEYRRYKKLSGENKNYWKLWNPIWWSWVVAKKVIGFPFFLLSAAGFDSKKIENSLFGKLLKLILEIAVGVCIAYIVYRFGWNK